MCVLTYLALCVCVQRLATEDDALLRRAIQARSSGEAYEVHKSLLRDVSATRLQALQTDPNHGIALRAALEQAARAIERQDDATRAAALHRFAGFVQGRLPVAVPEWWEATLLTAGVETWDGGDRFYGFRFPGSVTNSVGAMRMWQSRRESTRAEVVNN